MKRPKETLTSREIIEKLTPALEKPAKEFIDDFLTIFACYAKFSYPQHERICRKPYFTYEDGIGFYSDGSPIGCRDEIVLGHEFTTALYAWGLWEKTESHTMEIRHALRKSKKTFMQNIIFLNVLESVSVNACLTFFHSVRLFLLTMMNG
ncbi:MAG: hypothetical protein V8Q84_11240 [Bilophila sp.]